MSRERSWRAALPALGRRLQQLHLLRAARPGRRRRRAHPPGPALRRGHAPVLGPRPAQPASASRTQPPPLRVVGLGAILSRSRPPCSTRPWSAWTPSLTVLLLYTFPAMVAVGVGRDRPRAAQPTEGRRRPGRHGRDRPGPARRRPASTATASGSRSGLASALAAAGWVLVSDRVLQGMPALVVSALVSTGAALTLWVVGLAIGAHRLQLRGARLGRHRRHHPDLDRAGDLDLDGRHGAGRPDRRQHPADRRGAPGRDLGHPACSASGSRPSRSSAASWSSRRSCCSRPVPSAGPPGPRPAPPRANLSTRCPPDARRRHNPDDSDHPRRGPCLTPSTRASSRSPRPPSTSTATSTWRARSARSTS